VICISERGGFEMRTETQLFISVVVFGIMGISFITFTSYNPFLALSILIICFISYWFGRFWEKKIMKTKEEVLR